MKMLIAGVKRKPVLSIAIATSAIAAIVLAVLAATGILGGGDRLTKRPYIWSSDRFKTPHTLSEYLNTENVSLELLLDNETFTAQLLEADTLTDIVDSRLSLSNLRILQKQASNMIESDHAALRAGISPGRAAQFRADAASAAPMLSVGMEGDAACLLEADLAKQKLDSLLAREIPVLRAMEAQVDLKCVWTAPDDVLLHWTPHGDWVPEDGYRLYRTVNGSKELLKEHLGAMDVIAGVTSGEYAAYIRELFNEAALTQDKLDAIGVKDAGEFASLVCQTTAPLKDRMRIASGKDFAYMRNRLLAIPATVLEKMPDADAAGGVAVLPVESALLDADAGILEEFDFTSALTVIPFVQVKNYAALDAVKTETIERILGARRMILAKAFVDGAFAADAGFGYRDSLKSLGLPKGTSVIYSLEATSGQVWSCTAITGEETPLSQPAGLDGYGMDNAVSLRWTAPVGGADKSLISGYYIERKKQGEAGYTRLTREPVAISYSLDETGVYFEVPVFYQDTTLANGQTASYRIQSLDIFGRKSAYSEPLELTVYKVTPPDAPRLDQPVLSTKAGAANNTLTAKLIASGKGSQGVALCVNTASEDTGSVVFYRAKAYGAGAFDMPVEIGRAALDGTVRKAAKTAETGFYDKDVMPGYYYKYWAAALDGWGNESAWSESRVVGVSDEGPPQGPQNLTTGFISNNLKTVFDVTPGFGSQIIDEKTYSASEIPAASNTWDVSAVNAADIARADNVRIGVPLARAEDGAVPGTLSALYGNLPEPGLVHAIVAVTDAELTPDGSARVGWAPFSGSGVSGYHVYRSEADGKTMLELQAMGKEEAIQGHVWRLVRANTGANKLTDTKPPRKEGRIYLYMVCLAIEAAPDENAAASGGAERLYAAGGWVKLSWVKPDDPQIRYYRVYRSEVSKSMLGAAPETLEWTLVSDQCRYTGYTEKVDQTYAHYYDYKVTTVSVWGVESSAFAFAQVRIPATSPPQTPSMLMPLSQPGRIAVNWTGVPHAGKYSVYRAVVPRMDEADIVTLQNEYAGLYECLFVSPLKNEGFLAGRMATAPGRGPLPGERSPLISADKLNTLRHVDSALLEQSLRGVGAESKVKAYRYIVEKYGPLALAPYGDLSEAAAKLVIWVKVGEVPADESDESPGSIRYTDAQVTYGYTYLYTVQAENDDGLVSARPAPVSASPRRAKPFDPVGGLKGSLAGGKPKLSWDPAREAGRDWRESRRDIAGYIVYRGAEAGGPYCQASPLLDTVEWVDDGADPAAYNWYKVKVVDTAGYFSGFSEAVLIKGEPESFMAESKPAWTAMPGRVLADTYDSIAAGAFTLTDVKLKRGAGEGAGLLSIGIDEPVPVTLQKVTVIDGRLMRGDVSLKQPVYLKEAGLTLTELSFFGEAESALVSGYLNRPAESSDKADGNLLGGMYGLRFAKASVTPDGVLTIPDMPGFQCGNIRFAPSGNAAVALKRAADTPFIRLSGGTAAYYPDIETIDHEGLAYRYDSLSFDGAGRLTGKLIFTPSPALRLVAPAGLGLRADASVLTMRNGAVAAGESTLKGRIILPFLTYEDSQDILQARDLPNVAPGRADLDALIPALAGPASVQDVSVLVGALDQEDIARLDDALQYLAYRAQYNALPVLPGDASIQLCFSSIPFDLAQWGGSGFSIPSASMTPAYIGNSAGNTSQCLALTPYSVAVDLDRASSVVPVPLEAQDPPWMGIAVLDGRLSLPTEYVRTDTNGRMSFNLTPGELLYSLNGFSYQNVVYSAKGSPANFGEELGGFADVLLLSSMIDMYGNNFTLEMDADVGLAVFGNRRVKARLYASKETGELQCAIAGTDYMSLSDTGEVKLKLAGGYLRGDGMHLNGRLDVDFSVEKLKLEDAAFNELVIPADPAKMVADGPYGNALLEKPLTVQFYGFPMEIRGLSLTSAMQAVRYSTQLRLLGSTQLSDNMVMNPGESQDSVAVSDITGIPAIDYGGSRSHMHFVFEDYLTFDGDVAPSADPGDEDIVYYDFIDDMDMLFNSIGEYKQYPVTANGRIGYDRKRDRYFFALGSYYNDTEGEGISIYYGYINQICGILAYNMDLQEDSQGRFVIPKDSAAMFAYVDSIPVSKSDDSNCFFASACNISLSISDIKVCEIRDVYLLVEAGPTLESGGDFYGPFDLEKLVSGGGFSYAGPGEIGYYHADKLYRASTSLIEQPMYTLHVSGDMGIELCPAHWDIRLGYPEPMVARTDYELDGRFGMHFHASQSWSYIEAQAAFGYDTGVLSLTPEVYVRGNIAIGASGEYDFSDRMFRLAASVSGGVEGGLHVLKKRFPIIHLWLDAAGEINTANNAWDLKAQAAIHYSLDLWVHDFEGTVTWTLDRRL